jgi:hypothetical protein
MVVDGDPCERRRRHGEVGHPVSMAIGLSEELLLEDESIKAGLFPVLGSNEEGWWRPTTTRRKAGGGAE